MIIYFRWAVGVVLHYLMIIVKLTFARSRFRLFDEKDVWFGMD